MNVPNGFRAGIAGEGKEFAMVVKFVTLFLAGLMLAAAPALAAPQWVEDACWRAANRVLPGLTAREREAYVTNCIADWTAGTPPPKPGSSTNRNRY